MSFYLVFTIKDLNNKVRYAMMINSINNLIDLESRYFFRTDKS